MNKLILLLITFMSLVSTDAFSQDKWEVLLNKASLAKGTSDAPGSATITAKALKTTHCIYIKFTSATNESGWGRTFFINNEEDHVIKKLQINKQSGTVSLPISDIEDQLKNKQPLTIYTTSLPNDPGKASAIRVRRIMLCKIEWN